MLLIATQQLDQDVGAAAVGAVAAVGPLNGAKVRLSKRNGAYARTTTLADGATFNADYGGYADALITWGPATVGADGELEFRGSVPEFRPTDATASNQIYGMEVVNAAGDKLYFVGAFDQAPRLMRNPLDAMEIDLRYRPRGGGLVAVLS